MSLAVRGSEGALVPQYLCEQSEAKRDAMISDGLHAACSLGQYPPSVIIKEQQRKLTQKHER